MIQNMGDNFIWQRRKEARFHYLRLEIKYIRKKNIALLCRCLINSQPPNFPPLWVRGCWAFSPVVHFLTKWSNKNRWLKKKYFSSNTRWSLIIFTGPIEPAANDFVASKTAVEYRKIFQFHFAPFIQILICSFVCPFTTCYSCDQHLLPQSRLAVPDFFCLWKSWNDFAC